jgi:homoserine dehydrogenase
MYSLRVFWSCYPSYCKYAQSHGDDALCKRFILSNLGEPGSEKIDDVIRSGGANSTTKEREVGSFSKDVIRLIHEANKDMTMTQIVQIWRSKGKNTPDL